MTNPLLELERYGQSVWLDYIRRNLISSGELTKLIKEDGLKGVTSNPSIFEKAIAGSSDYIQTLTQLSVDESASAKRIYESLAIKDIQDAADLLRPVYDKGDGFDGYVSLEVSPYLAKDTAATIEEARRLHKEVNRPNVMIKVPATDEGLPAIRQLIAEGININITLLFSMAYFEKVALAYWSGLEERVAQGLPINRIHSVASFFISRIDSLVDAQLTKKANEAPLEHRGLIEHLMGKAAIANAKLTYQRSKELYQSARWQALLAKGAHEQRLLWASTSTKNPKYSDVLYIEELIGKNTVNTIPPATMDAFRDHGKVQDKIETGLEEAHDVMQSIAKEGLNFEELCHQLTEEGVKLFADAFDKLLNVVEEKRREIQKAGAKMPAAPQLGAETNAGVQAWDGAQNTHRLWARDASLWTKRDEASWMGWLDVTESSRAQAKELKTFAEEIRKEGFSHVLLLGMGGSSLCPQVLQKSFGNLKGYPELRVLDSTDPTQIAHFEAGLDLSKCLFIVSSKSGGTLEPNIFKQYFFDKVQKACGAKEAGKHFVAITDPGTKLEKIAQQDQFRRVFHGVASIGGRYSALSAFGMVPAALMGVDVERFLDAAEEMVHACAPSVSAADNPGVRLGIQLGSLTLKQKDKVTLLCSPKIKALGAWLEQLLAESTGKIGKGLIPIDEEPLGDVASYGHDRVFAFIRLEGDDNGALDQFAASLQAAGQPVIKLSCPDLYHLGAEFFRWEIATAVAGSVIGINPFDQPDVEASKIETRKLTDAFEVSGQIEALPWFFEDASFKFHAPQKLGQNSVDILKAHFARLQSGDYANISAYIEMNDAHDGIIRDMRALLLAKKRVATCHGFGPRFLHSTGQAYKGGPNSGVFLEISCDDAADLAIPGQKYTFGLVKETQVRGDMAVLIDRGRRVLRVHLRGDTKAGLLALRAHIEQALA